MSTPVMQVRLTAGYGSQRVLQNIDLELHAGEALGVVGASGAGKSTLAMALLGLLGWRNGWSSGDVSLDGKNLLSMKEREARRIRGKRISLIPQSPMSALNPAVTLQKHFETAWRAHEDRDREALSVRLRELLEEVQLPARDPRFLRSKPSQISVGQAQRVLIALALLHRPSILIADEPTSALDPVTQTEIVRLLRQLTRHHGVALLYISHDLVSVVQLCERLAVLHAGSIAECLPVEEIERAQHPATQALFASLPVPLPVLLAYTASTAALSAHRSTTRPALAQVNGH